jgi:hypothetical protein
VNLNQQPNSTYDTNLELRTLKLNCVKAKTMVVGQEHKKEQEEHNQNCIDHELDLTNR